MALKSVLYIDCIKIKFQVIQKQLIKYFFVIHLCTKINIFLQSVLSFLPVPSRPFSKCPVPSPSSPTSGDKTDGTEEACLCVVHLDGQQLVGKSEHQVSEWAEASVVHLRSIEGQPVRKGHGVLVGGVPCTDPQDLKVGGGRQRQAQIQCKGVICLQRFSFITCALQSLLAPFLALCFGWLWLFHDHDKTTGCYLFTIKQLLATSS